MAWSQLAQGYKCFVCGSNSIQGFSNDKILITLKKRKEMVWLLKQSAQRYDVLLLFVGSTVAEPLDDQGGPEPLQNFWKK